MLTIKLSINLIIFVSSLYYINSFIFSVIIAVYNTEKYLDDSVVSLINQTIGIKNIQIILVNDGSTDNSEEICFLYKRELGDNIIYIKINHSGVSKARNIGLEYAKGKFINFLDADDKWDSQAFKNILIFFEFNKNVDIVAGRLLFFEAINSYHPLDYKFYKTRVANLTNEYNCVHLSGASSFFLNSVIKEKKFMENVFTGEDTIFINNILLLKPLIGFVREAIYYYRRRADYSSAVQTQTQKADFYFSQIKYVGQYLLDKSKQLYNYIPPFIKFYIGYNNLFRIISPAFIILNKKQLIDYCNIIEDQLKQIEDKYILEQKFTSYKIKIFTLSKKYKRDIRYDIVLSNELLIYSKHIIIDFKNTNNIIIWKFLEIKDNSLHLEGKDNFWMPRENYYYFCIFGNKTIFPTYYYYSGYNFYTMYGLIEKGRSITFDINIGTEKFDEKIIKFFISFKGKKIEIFPSLGTFTHIPSIKNSYYSNGNFIIKIIERRINIYKFNKNLETLFEKQYCFQLKSMANENTIKLRKNYIKYRDSNKRKIYKQIWIINDKQEQAGDNGEYFFRYLMIKRPSQIKVYFVIKKNSDDYERLKKFGNILNFNSSYYLNTFLIADKIISSVTESWVTNPFGYEQKYIKDLFHFDIIYLQNGIIKDDLSSSLNKYNKNFSIITTSSKKEYKTLLSSNYGYNKNNIILTGLPRYDNLLKKAYSISNEKLILIIPAFRKYIKGTIDLITSKPIHSNNFKNSTFYKFYNDFINEQKLLLSMEKFNYTGIICLHPYFSQQSEDFITNNYFYIKDKCNYQELLVKASLFITDYSNVLFDFAYLKKPIIFTQFDIEEYRKFGYPKGYFDYKKDGFGPVCNDLKCSVNEVIKAIKNNCQLSKIYLNRIKKYFVFMDNNNNYRIFNILNHNHKEKEKIIYGNESLLIWTLITCIFFIIKKL